MNLIKFLERGLLFAVLSLFVTSSFAIGETAGDLASNQVVQTVSDQQISNSNVTWQTPQYAAMNSVHASKSNRDIKVFGEQVFAGGFSSMRSDGLNASYKISPGDQIILRVWGATEIDRVLPVDSQGNIFIPTIGPVPVAGVTNSQLNAKVKGAVKSIYSDNVSVYTQLQGVQPISVYVTGFVNKPGHYAGTPSDAILYFLNQAQGIDSALGSYRDIQLIRDNKTIAEIDLYAFLTQGYLPKLQLAEGDTLFVGQRGATITVTDPMAEVMLYELKSQDAQAILGSQVADYMVLNADVSHVLLHGFNPQGPFSKYLTLADFKKTPIHNGDQIVFAADQKMQTILVQIEGSYLGRSSFILPKDTKLNELLNVVPVDAELTDVNSISIRRKSVQEQQKSSLESSLKRLEMTYLTASSSTAEEASIRVKEAELIMSFVKRAQAVEPNGRLVVASSQGIANVRLQDGDIITIPSQSESILLSGQVLVPTSFVYQAGFSVQDYITKAGGFTEQADEDKIVLIRQSGEVIADASAEVFAGDEILVLPKVPTKNIQLATSVSQILYQIAIAAKVAFDL